MLDSFRSRLVLSNLLITLLGLLLVVSVFTQLLVNRSTEVKRSDRAAQAQTFALHIEWLFQHGAGPDVVQRNVTMAGGLLGVHVIVTNKAGAPCWDSTRRLKNCASGTYHIDPQALRAGVSAIHALKKSSDLYVFQSPLHSTRGRGVIGAVQLIARVVDVRPSLTSFLGLLLAVLGVALLVWLVIGVYFTVSISRPLLRINEATERMAAGDYNVRVRARGDSEIARLALSFNDMARKVQETSQLLRDFVANVSHDLRTPLTIITGFSQALLDGTARPTEVGDSATVIHEEAVKMQRLVDDLLQLTRLESGLLKLDLHAVELHPVVQNLFDRTAHVAGDTLTVQLHNAVPPDLPPIQVDLAQFERALRNLVDNAVNYTPAGGSVTVGARITGTSIEIEVTDTGRGIPAADLSRIFERFYRSDKSRERSQGHSGLGLAIVREIIEAHGGTVQVGSVEGRGTTFRMTVPRAQAASGPQSPGTRRQPVQEATR